MIIKTRISKLDETDISSYKNKPVLDKFSRTININENLITGNDDSYVIGVIKEAEIIGEEIELTLELFNNRVKRELLDNELISISIS